MDSIFETLLDLPLLRGVSRERIAETAGATKFHFLKYRPGDVIIAPGQQFTHMVFLLSGRVRIATTSPDGRFCVGQTLTGPDVVLPHHLFGRITTSPGSATALDACSIMQVDKNSWLKILNSDPIFMLNYLNSLSCGTQNVVEGVLAVASGSVAERLAAWVVCMTQPGATDIVVGSTGRDLCSVFGVSRTSFASAMERLSERGLIRYANNEIVVNDRRDMLAIVAGTAKANARSTASR